MATRKYRIIILGAGFSVQAHLPLADELWMKILAKRKTLRGRAAKFNDDLDSYIKYCKECDGKKLTYESVNFEEFLGFLDIEHYLELRGGDTWSDNGNEGQIVIKTFIGEILSGYMPGPNDIPELYLEFARRLQPNDYVLTFNYDVLLERALDAVGKPYRLFPERYNSSKEEVIIRKLHGSIDWFDKRNYLESVKNYQKHGTKEKPNNIIFNCKEDWGLSKILDDPRHDDDPLFNIYRATDIENLYKKPLMFLATPWILTPSTNKIVYAKQLRDFWSGLGRAGGTNFGMTIVGFSLAPHDIYTRQAIYSLVKNYQVVNWGKEMYGQKKSPLVLVDCKTTEKDIEDYKKNYRFVDFRKAELHMKGFDLEAIEKIFS